MKNLLSLIAIVLSLAALSLTIWWRIKPNQFANEAFPAGHPDAKTPEERFMATECEVIRSRKVLDRAVHSLDLARRWGVGDDAAIQELRKTIDVRAVPGTNLIAIRARHTDAGVSRDIANEVTTAYSDHRTALQNEQTRKTLEKFDEALRKQEEVVEEKRKILFTLVQCFDLPKKERDAILGDAAPIVEAPVESRSMSCEELKQWAETMEGKLKSLLKYKGDQLIEFAACLDFHENPVPRLKPKFDKARIKLADLKASGLEDQNPQVAAQMKIVKDCRKQIDEGIAALRDMIRMQIDLAKVKVERMEKLAANTFSCGPGLTISDLQELKKEFDQAHERLSQMQTKFSRDRINLALPRNPVFIQERATMPRTPVPGTSPPLYEACAVIQINPPAR